jgi:hypothetical protein
MNSRIALNKVFMGPIYTCSLALSRIAVFLFLLSAISANAAEIFKNDAESTPIVCQSSCPNPTYTFDDDEPGVSRSSEFSKNGSWSIKHEVTTINGVSECSAQTPCPKVLKFFDAGSGLPGTNPQLTDFYVSHWFYIPATGINNGYETDSTGGNWQIFTNHSEFKCANEGSSPCPIGAKLALSFNWFNGSRRLFLAIDNPKYNAAATSYLDTWFPADYFTCSAACQHPLDGPDPRRNVWVFTGVTVPVDEWFFFEWRLHMSQTNGQLQLWYGRTSTGVLTELVNFSDANLNTLTMFDDNANQWSDNTALYWAGGNYLSNDHTEATYTLFTDDWRITTTQMGPTLFSVVPAAPTGFRIQ